MEQATDLSPGKGKPEPCDLRGDQSRFSTLQHVDDRARTCAATGIALLDQSAQRLVHGRQVGHLPLDQSLLALLA